MTMRKKYCFSLLAAIILTLHMIAQTDIRQQIRQLPLLEQPGTEIHYQGSIDKTGGNADWDWYLYEDLHHEWVVLDVDGPGCIQNLTQHRYLTCKDPLFRFYLDGSDTPQYQVRLSELGISFPFKKPWADSYIGPYDNGRGPIRVARSFVPIAFSKHCKVTTDMRLYGNDRERGESGWGHIIYHTYATPSDVPQRSMKSENLEEIRRLKARGYVAFDETQSITVPGVRLVSGSEHQLAHINHSAVLTAVRLYAEQLDSIALQNIWLSITFDGHQTPDIYCPIGAFFGNSLGLGSTEYLLMGVTENGTMYNTFPMPFWNDAELRIVNKGQQDFQLLGGLLLTTPNSYQQEQAGYFRNTPFYSRRHTEGEDSRIAHVTGWGKMVAAHITCWAKRPNLITCEGDVHLYIDGERTPRLQSDGSESYVSYGWGFPTPPENHLFGGYDGLADNPWSMTRLCVLDYYPFNSQLNFNIESGEHNNQYLEHSGTVFYYGQQDPAEVLTDNIMLSDKQSLRRHKGKIVGEHRLETVTSVYEGTDNQQHMEKTFVTYGPASSLTFQAKILPNNKGIRLVRTSNQRLPRQLAQVLVDGQPVTERNWYHADNNQHMQWLDDSFVIPAHYTKGKKTITIQICPQPCDGHLSWTDAAYQIYTFK